MPPKKTLSGKKEEPAKVTKGKTTKAPEKQTKTPPPSSRAVVKSQTKSVSTDVSDLIGDSAGQGTDMFGSKDVQRPNIRLMQSNSPYIKKRHEKYVEGCEDGNILVSGANHIYQDSIRIIVVGYARSFVEWKPRDDGGGMIGSHPYNLRLTEGLAKGKGGCFITEDGNELVDTMAYFVLYEAPDGQWLPAMLFLSLIHI